VFAAPTRAAGCRPAALPPRSAWGGRQPAAHINSRHAPRSGGAPSTQLATSQTTRPPTPRGHVCERVIMGGGRQASHLHLARVGLRVGHARGQRPLGVQHRALCAAHVLLHPAPPTAVASQYFLARTDATPVNPSQNGRQKGRNGRRTAPAPPVPAPHPATHPSMTLVNHGVGQHETTQHTHCGCAEAAGHRGLGAAPHRRPCAAPARTAPGPPPPGAHPSPSQHSTAGGTATTPQLPSVAPDAASRGSRWLQASIQVESWVAATGWRTSRYGPTQHTAAPVPPATACAAPDRPETGGRQGWRRRRTSAAARARAAASSCATSARPCSRTAASASASACCRSRSSSRLADSRTARRPPVPCTANTVHHAATTTATT
jgi:hypothetical protein